MPGAKLPEDWDGGNKDGNKKADLRRLFYCLKSNWLTSSLRQRQQEQQQEQRQEQKQHLVQRQEQKQHLVQRQEPEQQG